MDFAHQRQPVSIELQQEAQATYCSAPDEPAISTGNGVPPLHLPDGPPPVPNHVSEYFGSMGDAASAQVDQSASSSSTAHPSHGGWFSRAFHDAESLAAGAVHEVEGAANAVSHGVDSVESGVRSGIHSAEDWVGDKTHALADRVGDVPVLGSVARGAAAIATGGTQLLGGVVEGATDLVGGVVNTVAHPLNTAAGLEAVAEHAEIPGLSTSLRAGHDLIDGRSLRDTANRALNPFEDSTRAEDSHFWHQMGHAVAKPYEDSIHEGRGMEAVGRGIFDIGSFFTGAGEAGEAARVAEVGGEAGRMADVARTASVARDAGEARIASDATTAARDADTAQHIASVSEDSAAAKIAPETEEAQQLRQVSTGRQKETGIPPEDIADATDYAKRLGMPEDRIEVNTDRETSWGQVFGEEKMYIGGDLRPMKPAGKSLTANQQVSARGAIAHEVVGHRESDLAGYGKLKSYQEYGAMEPEESGAAKMQDNALDEAQASLRAAKFAPELTNAERKVLFKDAMGRLGKIDKGVDDVPDLGLNLKERIPQ